MTPLLDVHENGFVRYYGIVLLVLKKISMSYKYPYKICQNKYTNFIHDNLKIHSVIQIIKLMVCVCLVISF